MKKISELTDLKDKTVLLRSSLNVPIENDEVRNTYRIVQALPTMRYLHECRAKTILIAHIGRDQGATLKPVYKELERFLPVQWGGRFGSEEFNARREMLQPGEMLMVENIRQDQREKENSDEFAQELAAGADLYVNDAFANSHREHTTMSALAKKLPAYAGLNLIEEVTQLERVISPKLPALFMLGGAKFDTKLPLVDEYIDSYNHIFIGGALANDLFKAKGYNVGVSLVSDFSLNDIKWLNSERILLPVDVTVDGPNGVRTVDPRDVEDEEKILDCGPKTVAMLRNHIKEAKTILWNGPFGDYEAGFNQSTEAVVKLLAENSAFSVVGGGDTVASIEKMNVFKKLGFVSTGGGAMLRYLEDRCAPVLDLLN